MMTYWKTIAAGLAIAMLGACESLPPEARTVAGAAGGAAAGLITAEALGAGSNWRLIAALAGASAGTLVAHNTRTGSCAYARGDGTYYRAACPT